MAGPGVLCRPNCTVHGLGADRPKGRQVDRAGTGAEKSADGPANTTPASGSGGVILNYQPASMARVAMLPLQSMFSFLSRQSSGF